MPLPSEILMIEGRFGTAFSIFGENVALRVDVRPTHELVWAATGQPVLPFGKTFSVAAGMEGTFSVPAVDQAGWLLQSTGEPFTMWAYIVDITYTLQGQNRKRSIKWQPLVGQVSVDLDLISGGLALPPVAGDIAVVSSLAGMTGEVTVEDLEALGLGGGGPGGSTAWSDITGKPSVIAAGASKAAARTAVDAAAVSDIPTYGTLTGKPAFIAAGATEIAARGAIGALGATDIPTPPNWSNISGKPAVVAAGATTAAARAAIEAISQGDLDARIATLINGAPASLDTLKEIADALASDDTDIAALMAALNTRATIAYVDQEIAKISGGGGGGTTRPKALTAFDGGIAGRATSPARIVFAGSSTTAGGNASVPAKRWVNTFISFLQSAYPSGTGSEASTQASTSASFTLANEPGIQGFNVGEFSTTAASYLLTSEMDTIAAMDPSLIVHMVGTNDFRTSRAVATFKSDLTGKINYLKTKTTRRPCSHVIVAAYEPWDMTGSTPWIQFVTAMGEIAAADPDNIFFVNLNPLYINFLIPGAKGTSGTADTDPYSLISSDKLHQNDKGHEQMARWIYKAVMGVEAPTGSNPGNPGSGGTVGPVTDNFNRTSTTSLGGAQTGQNWSASSTGTWATNGTVGYLSSGSNGIAVIECGYSDIDMTCDVLRTGAITGIRVRSDYTANTALSMYFDPPAGLIRLATITNGTIVTKDSVAIPAEVPSGTWATLRLVASGTDVVGYLNGTRILSFTMSAAEMTTFSGTAIALRQVSAGAASGAFDNLDAKSATIVVPPGVDPVSDDFNRAASTTSMGSSTTGQTWTSNTAAIWGISADGKAYMVNLNGSGSSGAGVATVPYGSLDVDLSVDMIRPNAGYSGIGVRTTGSSSRLAAFFAAAENKIAFSTVEGGTSTERGSYAVPTSTIAVGAAIKLRLKVVGANVEVYLNDIASPVITYTLTGTQLTGITGTAIGIRQTIAGTANGGFDNFSAKNVGTVADQTVMPTGTVASNGRSWTVHWSKNFTEQFALGQAKATHGWDLFSYDGGLDTSDWGTYNADKTVSGISGDVNGANGVLNIRPVVHDTDARRRWVAALTPPPPAGSNWGQLSGRYSVRMRIVNVTKGNYTDKNGVTRQDSGHKVAFLIWPAKNAGDKDTKGVTVIDPWDYGENNWPEGAFHGVACAYAHFSGGSAGSRNHGNAMAYEPSSPPFTEWHTYTMEWIAGVSVKYLLDGVQVAQAPLSGVPTEKMFQALQIETWLDSSIPPPVGGSGDVQIDWAVAMTLNP